MKRPQVVPERLLGPPGQPRLLHPMMQHLAPFEERNAEWAARLLTAALQNEIAERAAEIMAEDRANIIAQRLIREGQQ